MTTTNDGPAVPDLRRGAGGGDGRRQPHHHCYPDARLARGALVVFANWVLGTVFALATRITDGWWFNMLIDAGAAAVILWRFAGRWQIALGLTYCVQVAGHLFYGWMLSRDAAAPWPYYSWLTAIAWLQLMLIGGWSWDVWRRSSAAARAAEASRARATPGNSI
ncbi:MAG: hypothetical protein WDN24_03095 [Sphingomonas sp.]